jgi:hypothetical protein
VLDALAFSGCVMMPCAAMQASLVAGCCGKSPLAIRPPRLAIRVRRLR